MFFTVQTEATLASVERTSEYIDRIQQEAARHLPIDGQLVVDDWPGDCPCVVFEDVHLRYRAHLPWVLSGLSMRIEGRSKIGVVGRTGSGKSTLLSCLFRLLELEKGRILIADQDIAHVGLGLLRRRLTIVPQEPLLFSGTLRRNLDPLSELSDAVIIDGLVRCGMSDTIGRLEGGLSAPVAEQGGNFSVGERQVLCLSRALLRGTRLLCLDEATANIDPENDARIQKTIRCEFAACTVFTIAHRLHTIMDADKVLVLDYGKLAQFDSPKRLLTASGLFRSFVEQAGLATPGLDDNTFVV